MSPVRCCRSTIARSSPCARPDKDGYTALQLGVGTAKVKNVTKPQRGHFAKAKVEPKARLAEFRVSEDASSRSAPRSPPRISSPASVSMSPAPASARALPAAMKRHNFGGLRATHGVSVSHRSHGSTGQRQSPGKTFKNKKMAGHLGAERVTTQSLEVVSADAERGVLMVKGAVPGSEGGLVLRQGCGQAQGARGAAVPGGAARRRRSGAGSGAEAAAARGEPRHEARRPQPRQRGGRRHRARRRGVRAAGAPRHPGARRQLAARQAPRRHAQDQGHQRHPAARPKSPTSRRAPAGRARAACARRNSAAGR